MKPNRGQLGISRIGKITRSDIVTAAVLLTAVSLCLFSPFEIGQESWGYWLFARVFAETGRFVIPDRSPLYTVYLNLFRWIGYPTSVVLEHYFTLMICAASSVVFFSSIMGRTLAVFSTVLFIPFWQTQEPAVQMLALACSFIAIHSRISGQKSRHSGDQRDLAPFYFWLLLASMFRNTYNVMILLFLVYDAITVFPYLRIRFRDFIRNRRLFLLLIPMFLAVIFRLFQSDHPANTAWFQTSQWFPVKGKSLIEASMIQYVNVEYILSKFGGLASDFYFTNKELFGECLSLSCAVFSNPNVFVSHIMKNIFEVVPSSLGLTLMPNLLSSVSQDSFLSVMGYLLIILMAFQRGSRYREVKIFIVGSIFLGWVTVLASPNIRYFVPLSPVLVFSAWNLSKMISMKWPGLRAFLAAGLMLLFSPAAYWTDVLDNLVSHFDRGSFVPLEKNSGLSTRAAFAAIEESTRNCRGTLVLEHAFVGAFTDLPLGTVHDVFEIPPFGHLGESKDYSGLRPDRIDCILLSTELAGGVGAATNIRPRYVNYIAPYVERGLAKGAVRIEIPRYGWLIQGIR